MTRAALRIGLMATVLGLTLGSSATLSAQESGDRMIGCRPAETEEDRDKITILRSYAITRLAVSANNQVCRIHERVVKLFEREEPDRIDMEDVAEAALPEPEPYVPKSKARLELEAFREAERVRLQKIDDLRRSNAADDAVREANEREERERLEQSWAPQSSSAPYTGDDAPIDNPVMAVPDRQGGFIAIFQGRGTFDPKKAESYPASTDAINGEGTLMTAEGIAQGQFEGGELEGEGHEILADGTVRVGNFDDGELNGQGTEFREEGGQMVMVEAQFVNDVPDGTVEYSYDDGTSRRDLWAGGERVATGELAAAGKTPTTPVYRTREQILADEEAIFLRNIETADNPGTLFTLADELDELGNSDRARRAFRALVRRFPDSPLAAQAAARLGSSAGAAAPRAAPSGSGSGMAAPAPRSAPARYSSICMRDLNYLAEQASASGKQTMDTPGFYDALISMSSRCASYDSEARQEQQIKTRERGNSRYSDASNADLPWFRDQARRALSDPNYSASLGPYRLGPGGVGDGAAAGAASPAAGTGGYATQIVNRILPDSFHAQFTGRNLPFATCTAQSQTHIGYVENVSSEGMFGGYRKIMAATELGLAIFKQCEQDPAAKREIDNWQATRAQALENCRMVASVASGCLAPFRR